MFTADMCLKDGKLNTLESVEKLPEYENCEGLILNDDTAIKHFEHIFYRNSGGGIIIMLNGSEQQLLEKIKQADRDRLNRHRIFVLKQPRQEEIFSIPDLFSHGTLITQILDETRDFFKRAFN